MRKKILQFMVFAMGAGSGILAGKFIFKKHESKECIKTDKFKEYYNLLNRWLELKHQDKPVSIYFDKEKIDSIAIYGMGELGYRLLEELEGSNINVKYGIDQNPGYGVNGLEIKSLEDEFEKVDAIIVTPIFAFDEIEKKLREKFSGSVISIEDVIYDIV